MRRLGATVDNSQPNQETKAVRILPKWRPMMAPRQSSSLASFLGALALLGGFACAEPGNLLQSGDGENAATVKKWVGPIRQYTKDAHTGKACLHLPKPSIARARDWIEVDPSKTYELSGYFRSLNPKQPSRMLLDIRFYDADKQAIRPRTVRPVSSVSPLLADAPEGATSITVAKADWPKKAPLQALAFNAKEDLSDLPNSNFAGFSELRRTDAGIVIELAKPLDRAYPAGTGVRLHLYMNHPRIATNAVPEQWTRYAFMFNSRPLPKVGNRNAIWPGTKYMGVTILHQYAGYPKKLPEGEEPPQLLFDDIKLRTVVLEDEKGKQK